MFVFEGLSFRNTRSVPAKFQVSIQFLPDLLDLLDDLLDDLNHKFDPLIINMLLVHEP